MEMQFQQYPLDTQTFQVRYEGYSLPSSMMYFDTPIITLYQSVDGAHFKQNNKWTYDSSNPTVEAVNYGTVTATRYFSVANVEIRMTRISQGLVFRLIVPIFSLLIMSALVFWISSDQRINMTVTIILVMAVMYLIIFGNIPMLGYLTLFDSYCLVMHIVLFVCAIFHRAGQMLEQRHKLEQWGNCKALHPFLGVYAKVMEALGRLLAVPLAVFSFLYLFKSVYGLFTTAGGIALTCVFVMVVSVLEYNSVRRRVGKAMQEVNDKPILLNSLYLPEVLMYNRYHYGSWSVDRNLSKMTEADIEETTRQSMSVSNRGHVILASEINQYMPSPYIELPPSNHPPVGSGGNSGGGSTVINPITLHVD